MSLGGSGSAFLRCSDGRVRWGLYGAAGVVFVVRFPDGPRVMLQKRSELAHEGGTWSCAGGALDLGEHPLAGLKLTSADFADMATRLKSVVPERRVLVVLEGGYDLEALTYGVGATLSALVGDGYRPEPASSGEIGLPTVTAARQLWEL